MYWLRKFYGPTVFFAPKDEGAGTSDTDDADDDAGDDAADADDDAGDDAADADDDAGDDAADADDDAAEGDDDDVGGADSSSSSRRESRNARQARENRELRERTARLEGELSSLKKPVADTTDTRRVREEKLALMSPEERMAFEAKEETAQLRVEARNTQFMVLDMADKNAYGLLCTQDPVAAKHKDEVEKLLTEMRGNNTNALRETLLNYVIGKRAREAAKKPGGKKQVQKRREEANGRVNQSKSKPMSGRGDAGGGKGAESLDQMRQKLLAREARGDTN